MSWASLATELLWPNALVVVPLAALVWAVCRWIPCRSTTRHSLWLVVLLWFVIPPLLPELHASASGRNESSVLVVTEPQTAPVVQIPSDRRPSRSSRPIFDVPAPAARPTPESCPTWPRYARTMPPATEFGNPIASPELSETLSRVRRVTDAVEPVAQVPTMSRWQVLPSIFAVRDAVGRLPSIPTSVWLLGVAIVLLVRLIQVAAFRRIMRVTQPASGDVVNAVAAASGQIGLRHTPETLMIGESGNGQGRLSPFVWCAWRTRLILPVGLWSRLDEPGRRSVILHELAHLARRDHWVCRLTWAVCCVYWWHPVAWWVRRRLREEADFCCDGWVTWLMPRGRRAYAEALLTTKQYISLPRLPIPEFAIRALTGGAQGFAARIRFIMTQTVGPRVSVWGMGMVTLLSLVGWAATPVRSSVLNEERPLIPESNVVIQAVYVPAAPARLPDDTNGLDERLSFLEQRIESLSANFARLAATRTGRRRARMSDAGAAKAVLCPTCVAAENPIARASASLRSQINAIEVVASGINIKAAALRAQSHELRLTAERMARRASGLQCKAGSEDFDGVTRAFAMAAEAQVLRARGEAADAHAHMFLSQVRMLGRCAVQLQLEAEALDREQARLDVRVSPLRDWARAGEPTSARRRM